MKEPYKPTSEPKVSKEAILEKLRALQARYAPAKPGQPANPRYDAVSLVIASIEALPNLNEPSEVRRILVGIEKIKFTNWRGQKKTVGDYLKAAEKPTQAGELMIGSPHLFQQPNTVFKGASPASRALSSNVHFDDLLMEVHQDLHAHLPKSTYRYSADDKNLARWSQRMTEKPTSTSGLQDFKRDVKLDGRPAIEGKESHAIKDKEMSARLDEFLEGVPHAKSCKQMMSGYGGQQMYGFVGHELSANLRHKGTPVNIGFTSPDREMNWTIENGVPVFRASYSVSMVSDKEGNKYTILGSPPEYRMINEFTEMSHVFEASKDGRLPALFSVNVEVRLENQGGQAIPHVTQFEIHSYVDRLQHQSYYVKHRYDYKRDEAGHVTSTEIAIHSDRIREAPVNSEKALDDFCRGGFEIDSCLHASQAEASAAIDRLIPDDSPEHEAYRKFIKWNGGQSLPGVLLEDIAENYSIQGTDIQPAQNGGTLNWDMEGGVPHCYCSYDIYMFTGNDGAMYAVNPETGHGENMSEQAFELSERFTAGTQPPIARISADIELHYENGKAVPHYTHVCLETFSDIVQPKPEFEAAHIYTSESLDLSDLNITTSPS